MKYNQIYNTDIKVSLLSLGTLAFGEQVQKNKAFKILDFAFDQGINMFDTAEIYPSYPKKTTYGLSEKIIGEWQKKRKIRNKIIIASKIIGNNSQNIGNLFYWIRGGGKSLIYDKYNLKLAIDNSLKRLKTDYIDIYQLHYPLPNDNVNEESKNYYQEVLENLNFFVKQGKIRHIGVCNESHEGFKSYLEKSKNKKLPNISVIQNPYSLLNREIENSISRLLIKEKCSLIAHSPIAGGRLSGKYLNLKRPNKARYTIWPGNHKKYLDKRVDNAVLRYQKIANKYNVSLTNLAISFVISQTFVSSTIIGATSIEQIEENLLSLNLKMKKEISRDLNKIHKLDPNPCV